MIQIDFSSDFIDKDITKLSVISDADSFVYGLFDHNQTMVSRGKLSQEKAANFLQEWENKQVSIHYMSLSPAFTHLPMEEQKAFANPSLLKDLWQEDGIICFYEDSVMVHQSWTYKHITTTCLPFFKHKRGNRIWLHFLDKYILMACGADGKFLFFNQFEITTAEDVIYYLFALSRQVFQTEPENIQVDFSGQLTLNSSFYQLMYRYIKNLEAATHPDFRTANEDLADHVYFDHFLNIQTNAHH